MGIGLIIGLIAYLITNWDKLKKSLDAILPAGMKTADMFDEIKAVAVGVGNVLLNFVIAPFKILESLLTDGLYSAIEQAKQSYNAFENYQKGKQGQEINHHSQICIYLNISIYRIFFYQVQHLPLWLFAL